MESFSKYDLLSLAEISGIHAGDGYLRNDGHRIEFDLSGSVEEKVYYEEHVIPLFSNFFNIEISGKYFPHRNTFGFVIRNKEIVEKIHNLGFPYGNKSLVVRVPEFILNSSNDLKTLFLKGIFDTDGCINFDRRYSPNYSQFKRDYHTYPRVTLTTTSKNMFLDLQTILQDLSISFWPQIYFPKQIGKHTSFRIWIRGKTVENWMNLIGISNPIKLSRYQIWKKYGFCPVRTTYSDRLRVLNQEIKPEVFYGLVA